MDLPSSTGQGGDSFRSDGPALKLHADIALGFPEVAFGLGRFWSNPINGRFQSPRRISKLSKRPPLVALEMCGRLQ